MLVAAAVVIVAPTAAWGGQVKGKVAGVEKLINPAWNEAKDAAANRYTWREPSPTVKPEFRALSAFTPKELCIVALGEAPQHGGGAPLAFKVGGGRTTPVTLVVAPGTTLEFQNRDPFAHRPYVVGEPTFKAEDMKPGTTRQWAVPKPGTYEVRDELAPSVRSWVVVEPNLVARAYVARDGTFSFGNLPSGEYELRAYFNGVPVSVPRQTKVTDKGLELKEAIAVEPPAPAPAPKGAKE